MKNVIVSLAVALMAVSASASLKGWQEEGKALSEAYKNEDNPIIKAAAGVLTSPLGKTIYYSGKALEVLDGAGHELVAATVDAGKCATEQTNLPNDVLSCGINYAGETLSIVEVAAFDSAATGVYYVTDVPASLLGIFAESFEACHAQLGDGWGTPCQVIALPLSVTSQVVAATGMAVGGGLEDMGANGKGVIKNSFGAPSHLLQGELDEAAVSALKVGPYFICTVGQLVTTPLRLMVWGLTGNMPSADCTASIESEMTVERMKNGPATPIKTKPGKHK